MQIKFLDVSNHSVKHTDEHCLKEFLTTQKNLEHLSLQVGNLFQNDEMTKMNFKLKSLWMEGRVCAIVVGRSISYVLNNNHVNFINCHKESLITLKLRRCTIEQDFLVGLPKVEKFCLDYCNVSVSLTCSKLKSLEMFDVLIGSDVDFNWDNNQLKELVIYSEIYEHELIENFIQRADVNLDRLELVSRSGRRYQTGSNYQALRNVIDENRHKIQSFSIE